MPAKDAQGKPIPIRLDKDAAGPAPTVTTSPVKHDPPGRPELGAVVKPPTPKEWTGDS